MERLQCPHCESTFAYKRNLDKHKRKFHKGDERQSTVTEDDNEEDEQIACNICAKKFRKAQHLYNHRLRYHTKEQKQAKGRSLNTFKCDKCGKGHINQNSLKCHRRRCWVEEDEEDE